jgi:rhamnosyltransferase
MQKGGDVAAGVVLYGPTAEELEKLEAYSMVFPIVVAADNSDSHVEPVVGVEWVSMGGNAGLGAALNALCKGAKHLGYTWLLTLDQDTPLDLDFIEEYLSQFQQFADKEYTAVIAPLTINTSWPEGLDMESRDVDLAMTSGSLMNLEIWEQVGGFVEELFIDEVDHEYCLRAKSHGYRIVQFNIRLPHRPGEEREVRGGRKIDWHPPKRLYYIARNYWYIKRKYRRRFPQIVASRKNLVLAKYKEWLRYHPGEIGGFLALVKGTFDGLMGRYGR